MRTIRIKLYQFNELNKAAQQKAIEQHSEFLDSMPETQENKYGKLVEVYRDHPKREVIESIEINEYLFFEDGELAHCTTYTGKHPKQGITEFHFHGKSYNITK